MKKFIFIISIVHLCMTAEAQLFQSRSKDIQRLKNRSLVVIINDENPPLLKRYSKKPIRQEQIKETIQKSNKAFFNALSGYWNSSTSLIFLTEKDLSSLPAGDYSIFKFTPDERLYNQDLSQIPYELKRDLIKSKIYGKIEIYLMEDKKKDPVLTFYTPTAYPFEEDIVSSIAQMNHYLSQKYNDPSFNMKDYERLVEEWGIKIKDKTLLIDSATVERIQGKFDYIKEEYPYSYELTSGDKIAEKIKNRDSTCVIAIIFPHKDLLNRGGSYEGTNGGGMDTYSQEFFYTHLVMEPDTFYILGIGKNLDQVGNRRSWRTYYKFTETDNSNFFKK